MTKNERVSAIFNYAKGADMVRTKGEFAQKVAIDPASLSRIMKGKQPISDRALTRINDLFGNIFSTEWLLNGVGEMINPNVNIEDLKNGIVNNSFDISKTKPDSTQSNVVTKLIDEISAQRRVTEKEQEHISRLITIIEKFNK